MKKNKVKDKPLKWGDLSSETQLMYRKLYSDRIKYDPSYNKSFSLFLSTDIGIEY